MSLSELLAKDPYSLSQKQKEHALLAELDLLCQHHRQHCKEYAQILRTLYPHFDHAAAIKDIPYLPVGLFKYRDMLSIPREDVFKVLTSSGTTGQAVSRIFLDQETARSQTLALAAIMKTALGPERLPMVIIDSKEVLANRNQLTARAAAILGMMNFGRDQFFALNEKMELDFEGLKKFLAKYAGKRIFIYGFTFMVWQYLYKAVTDGQVSFGDAVLVHSGGWKRLEHEKVSKEEFSSKLKQRLGISSVYNFYGMVEQVGSIFLEGDDGYFYTPAFADVVIRNPLTWQECAIGEEGVVQVLSALPRSYPGHSILTEDLGIVHGIDDSTVNRGGKRFSISGRVPATVLRGCSDVHAYSASAAIS